MKNRTILFAISTFLMLSGSACSYHDFNPKGVETYSVDASKRIILIKKQKEQLIACTEPSPDVMTSFASQIKASGGNGVVKGDLSAQLSRDAAYIGYRNATVQLLRDGLYRACEGYFNNVLDESEYKLIVENFDRLMVALLAIDAASVGPIPANTPKISSQKTAQGKQGNSAPPSGAPNNPPAQSPPLQFSQTNAEVIQTVLQYMLDNNKWAFASCFNYMTEKEKKVWKIEKKIIWIDETLIEKNKTSNELKKQWKQDKEALAQLITEDQTDETKNLSHYCRQLFKKYFDSTTTLHPPVRIFQGPFGNKNDR